MFLTRLAAWGLVCVLTQAGTTSQQQGTPQRDPQAIAVLNAALDADLVFSAGFSDGTSSIRLVR